MSKTKHIRTRMSQRGISDYILDIAIKFGFRSGDKVYLPKKSAEFLIASLRNEIKKIERIKNKDGIVLIEQNDVKITTYGMHPR